MQIGANLAKWYHKVVTYLYHHLQTSLIHEYSITPGRTPTDGHTCATPDKKGVNHTSIIFLSKTFALTQNAPYTQIQPKE